MTSPNNHQNSSPDPLQTALSTHTAPPAEDWARLRGELARLATAEGLIDVAFERHDSPLGMILLSATEQGLVRIGLPAEDPEAVLEDLAHRISPHVLGARRESLTRARHQLDEYFERRRSNFDLPLDWQLTRGFRREVLRATAQIPYGHTATYRQVATQAGSPAAVRAAGTAVATNPLPILVPCHRVLRSDGQLGNYRGGPEAKAQLLSLEHPA